MHIRYVLNKKTPSIGDVKTKSDGSRFIRNFRKTSDGLNVVVRGRNLFDWEEYGSDSVSSIRSRIESGKIVHRPVEESKKSGTTIRFKIS